MADTKKTASDEPVADRPDNDIALTDVMLAMDVVDTLRHEESLVARELDADAREAELVSRVKRMYRLQGIEVSDRVVAEGVQALREQRFVYTPPPGGLVTTLLRGWAERGRLGKRILLVAGVGGLVWGAWWGLVTLPAQRARVNEAQAVNQAIAAATQSVRELTTRHERLMTALETDEATPSEGSVAGLIEEQHRQTRDSLDRADELLLSVTEGAPAGRYAAEDMADVGTAVHDRLDAQQQQIGQAREALDAAEASLETVRRVRTLPDELESLRAEMARLARESRAVALATTSYRDGVAALSRGDLAAADGAAAGLRDLIERLTLDYTLRIVSRPDERTGVWRYPEGNPNARNYYLIVEAVAPDGTRLELPITSEEDGQVRTVAIWGLRVDQATYDRVARDKQDDGIVENNVFGVKRRGYLDPEYRIPTTGGAITSWEDR